MMGSTDGSLEVSSCAGFKTYILLLLNKEATELVSNLLSSARAVAVSFDLWISYGAQETFSVVGYVCSFR